MLTSKNAVTLRLTLAIVLAALGVEGLREYKGRNTRSLTNETLNVAHSIRDHGAFADPFGVRTGATAHLAPVYPLIVAVLPNAGLHILRVCVLALHCYLLIVLGSRLFVEKKAGFAAACLPILLPVYSIEHTLYWEALIAATAAMAWVAVAWHRLPTDRWLVPGLLAGLVLLVSPAMLAVIAPASAIRSRIRTLGLFACTAVLVCVPWMVRNWYAVGSLSIRDNFGLEFHLSNNSDAHANMVDNWNHPSSTVRHPYGRETEAQKIRVLGEAAYFDRHRAAALQWVWSNPRGFLDLTAQRAWYFAFPESTGYRRYAWSVWLITAASLLALPVLYLSNRRVFWILSLALLVYGTTYSLIEAHMRYRYPILWISELLAGLVIVRASHHARQWASRRERSANVAVST